MQDAALPDFLGRYQILAKLGEGGMGSVYAARDDTLARKVAIKTIRKDLADESTRQRMWREARAAASVNHPNVCQVYEVGETDGELFMAMELLEGEALADRLLAGPLTLPAALQIAIEILAALEALHGQGFVHRDLKPSNIFCTPHGVKLLDFGIVLPLDLLQEEGERLTRTGMLVGTPAFMAPEQWTEGAVGPTADLFAVAAVLFEMITGEAAFQGKTRLDLYTAIGRDPAPTLSGGPALEYVDRVLQRAFAKQAVDRPESAAAMAAELQSARALVDGSEVATAHHLRRLLILPLRLLKADAEIDFLRVSLADALVSTLSRGDDLIVKVGSEKYITGDPDLAAIARETGVGMVLLGTLLRAGGQLRVTAQLVEVPDGAVLWTETKQTAVDDIFALQDELAEQIAASLTSRLRANDSGTGPRDVLRDVPRDVPATGKAYEYFLRANQLSYNFGMLPAARDLYLAALEEDPRFAPAWARLCRVYRVMAKYGHGEADYVARAEEAFLRALDLSPDLPTAHNLYAYYEIEERGRPQDALVRLLEQTRRAPTNADLLAGLVLACRFCGLLDASVEADRRARRLDPSLATSVAYTHWMRGDYEAAIRADDEDLRWNVHASLPMLGRAEEAIASLRQTEERTTRHVELDMLIISRAALEKDRATCVAAARRVVDSGFRDPEGLYYKAREVIYVGEVDFGLEILERGVAGGLSCDETIAADPWLESLREAGGLESIVATARARRVEASRRFCAAGGEILLGPIATVAVG